MAPLARIRFGDFDFDPASGELSGPSGTTRLQPRVAALLSILVEHAGAVVSRADLQTRLWPDTTVEFDDGLNFAIRQLRLALGDDAGAPRYVETLPKRGYRFLPTVSTATPPDSRREAGQVPAGNVAPSPASAPPSPRSPESTARAGRRGRMLSAALVLVAVLAVALWLGHQGRLPGQRPRRPRIILAVLPFTTDTTDSMMVAYQRRLFEQLGLDARAEHGLDSVTSRADGATHVLSGSVARQGNSVRVFVQLMAVAGHRRLWADDIVDSYAFSGNTDLTADRMEKNAARVLGVAGPP